MKQMAIVTVTVSAIMAENPYKNNPEALSPGLFLHGEFWKNADSLAFTGGQAVIPISFKNDKLGETTLFDAQRGGFPQTPIREKAKIHSGLHGMLSMFVIFI